MMTQLNSDPNTNESMIKLANKGDDLNVVNQEPCMKVVTRLKRLSILKADDTMNA